MEVSAKTGENIDEVSVACNEVCRSVACNEVCWSVDLLQWSISFDAPRILSIVASGLDATAGALMPQLGLCMAEQQLHY